jgi:hypothetical protein
MRRRMQETEEDRERRLLDEEVIRKQEERRKISELYEEERRRVEEEAAKPRVYAGRIWDAALWEINVRHLAKAHCYSNIKLTMNSSEQVSCKCIEQESLYDMRRRIEDGEFVLPILTPAPLSTSSKPFETVGFVKGYFDLETLGQGMNRGRYMDRSGRKLSSVFMMSRSATKVLTVKVLADKLYRLLDDGLVLSGEYSFSVDIHCDNTSSSKILTTNWTPYLI